MERLKMLRDAEQLLRETLEGVSALNNTEYAELCKLENDEKAIQELARRLAVAIADVLEN